MSKLPIEKRVQKYFENNRNAKEVFATSDEFLFNRKQDALSHSKGLKEKEVTPFKRGSEKASTKKVEKTAKKADKPTAPTKSEFLDQSVPKIKEALADKTEVAELEKYLEEEKAQEDTRSTAVEAIEERIAALTADKE